MVGSQDRLRIKQPSEDFWSWAHEDVSRCFQNFAQSRSLSPNPISKSGVFMEKSKNLAMILTSNQNIFAERLVEHNQGSLEKVCKAPKSLMGLRWSCSSVGRDTVGTPVA